MKKPRADQRLLELGLAESRTQAQALIMAGQVFIGTARVEKPGTGVATDAELTVKGALHPWVSRAGLKLAAALEHFGLSPEGLICADIGASTGGFTDVLLANGAVKVYAVDVGTGQLAWKLQTDPRVVRMDQTNARYLTAEQIPETPQVVVCDASFISLTIVLPAILNLAAPGAWLVALIKPQFEVGRENVGKGGIVRDPELHQSVCNKISAWLQNDMQWHVIGITPSPITGAEGNKEFLIAARK